MKTFVTLEMPLTFLRLKRWTEVSKKSFVSEIQIIWNSKFFEYKTIEPNQLLDPLR